MNTYHLMRALAEFGDYMVELRAAYQVAVLSGNAFAEQALFKMVERSEQVQRELGKIIDAAILTQKQMDDLDD